MWDRRIMGKNIIHKYLHNFNKFSCHVVCTLFYYGSIFLLEFNICYIIIVGRVAHSVERLTTGWTVRIESRWGRNFPPI